jgi:type I restriction enzyme, S subunit
MDDMPPIDIRPDLDLAIISDTPAPLKISPRMAEDFSESDLPWRVDVVDWATTRATFRKIIERDRVLLYQPPLSLTYHPDCQRRP